MIRALNLFTPAVFFCVCVPLPGKAQVIFEGQVFDKQTEQPISNVNVRLLKANVNVATNSNGNFRLVVDSVDLADSLVFSIVGYNTLSGSAKELHTQRVFLLTSSKTTLDEVRITEKKRKTEVLNQFILRQVTESFQRNPIRVYNTYPFSPNKLFYAKLFKAPRTNVSVLDV